MNWNLRTLRTRILSTTEVVEHFVPVHSELEHKTVEHFDLEHKTAEHMDPGPLQKLPSKDNWLTIQWCSDLVDLSLSPSKSPLNRDSPLNGIIPSLITTKNTSYNIFFF